jgi:hypothetical protein
MKENERSRIPWLLIIMGVVVFALCACQDDRPSVQLAQTMEAAKKICTVKYAARCHISESVAAYNGFDTCFYGQINRVLLVTEQGKGAIAWYVFFDPAASTMPEDHASIVDISVASNIYNKTKDLVVILGTDVVSTHLPPEGACVAVFGLVKEGRYMEDWGEGDTFSTSTIEIYECDCE